MANEQLKTLSDEDILAAAEAIIADEQALQKSMEQPSESNSENKEEQMTDEQKKAKAKEDADKAAAAPMAKSQADIEGKETGGLAPSVQGSLPDAGNGSEGGSEDEANPKAKVEKKKEESGEENKATQEGGSQDEANQKGSKKHLMKDGDPASESGGSDGQGQQGSSESQANPNAVINMLRKSIVELTKLAKAQNARIAALEASPVKGDDKEEMRKSMTAETIEVIAKSYNKKIRSLESENEEIKKSFGAQMEELKKSQDALAKENKEFKEKLSKPARTRETATNYDIIQKGNSEVKAPVTNKGEALEKLEELRKSGKVSGDELISFNASGHMTENVKKQLGYK